MRNWVKRKLVWLNESRERFLLVFLWPQNGPSRQQLEDHYTDTPDCRWLLPKVWNNSAQEGSVQGRAAHWSSDKVIDQEVSNMLACGVIVEVDPAERGFSSDIFTVNKVLRGEVYGKRVIIRKYLPFPSENIFNEGLAHTHPRFPAWECCS